LSAPVGARLVEKTAVPSDTGLPGCPGWASDILGKTLATLIPTFQFKKESQFDFIKQGGNVFVPAAFPEPSLNTFSFTFDLRRPIPSTKDRTDALNAMAAIYNRKAATNPPPKDPKTEVLKNYIDFAINPGDSARLVKLRTDITPFILQFHASIAKEKSTGS
jgi:hypothetical protein